MFSTKYCQLGNNVNKIFRKFLVYYSSLFENGLTCYSRRLDLAVPLSIMFIKSVSYSSINPSPAKL